MTEYEIEKGLEWARETFDFLSRDGSVSITISPEYLLAKGLRTLVGANDSITVDIQAFEPGF